MDSVRMNHGWHGMFRQKGVRFYFVQIELGQSIMNAFYDDWIVTGNKEDVVLGADLEYLGKKLKSELKLIGVDYN
jgi:hypothetical protein